MSTKNSLYFSEFVSPMREIHVYHEMLDDEFYIEDESKRRVRLPNEVIAKKIAEALKDDLK